MFIIMKLLICADFAIEYYLKYYFTDYLIVYIIDDQFKHQSNEMKSQISSSRCTHASKTSLRELTTQI